MTSVAKRRSPGTGTLEKTANQRWRFRLPGQDRKRSTETFATREEAEKMLNDVIYVLNKDGYIPMKGMTLREWGEQWRERRLNRSQETELTYWKTHIDSSFMADKPLTEISRADIKRFLYELSKKKPMISSMGGVKIPATYSLSKETQKRVLGILRQSLGEAVEYELIPANAAESVRISNKPYDPEDPDDDVVWTCLTLKEIDVIVNSRELIKDKPRIFYTVAIYTGLRLGELLGLRWEDVYLDHPQPWIHVKRSHMGPPKTKRSNRKVPLLKPAIDALLEWKELELANWRGKEQTRGKWVWCSKDGGIHNKKYRAGWSDKSSVLGNRTKLGIASNVRFHDFRHTCASHLLRASWGTKWTLDEVSHYLGHSSVKVTERYAHLDTDHLHKKVSMTPGRAPLSIVHNLSTNPTNKEASSGQIFPLNRRAQDRTADPHRVKVVLYR